MADDLSGSQQCWGSLPGGYVLLALDHLGPAVLKQNNFKSLTLCSLGQLHNMLLVLSVQFLQRTTLKSRKPAINLEICIALSMAMVQ